MLDLVSIEARLASNSLEVFGGFHPEPEDGAPSFCQTLLLIGPKEPGFWAHVTASAEFRDGKPDPIDRWSSRVLGSLARDLDGEAVFPFGAPPYQPFIRWATRTGRAWPSPVTLLVHGTAGLMGSLRGALALRDRLALPTPSAVAPCQTCHRPCEGACPVGALTAGGYDTEACRAFLETEAGSDCLTGGCRVRRACPLSQSYGRLPEQSAYHMRSFHPWP